MMRQQTDLPQAVSLVKTGWQSAFRLNFRSGELSSLWKRCLQVCLTVALGGLSATGVQADEVEPAAPPVTEQVPLPKKVESALQQFQQPGDDEVEALPSGALGEAAENSRKSLAYYMSGRSYEHDKKYKEAYAAYQKALEFDPKSLTLYRAMIPLAFRLDKTDEAIELARKAVELDPNNFELLSQLGIYALRQQDLQGSIDYFQKAVDSQTVNKKSGAYISIMSQLGQLYLSIGSNEKAAAVYETVFDALQHPSEYKMDFRTTQALEALRGSKAETLEMLGELFLTTDRLELAEAAFQKAGEASRGNQAIYSYQLARVLNKQKKYPEALAKLQEYFSAGLHQKGRGPYLLFAELLNATERGDEITAELEKLAASDEKNEELQLYLAERYVQNDQLDAAEKIYQKYLESGKNKGELQLGLLQIYRKREDAAQALQALTQAMLNGANTPRLEAELELLAQNEALVDTMIKLGREREDGDTDKRELFSQAYLLAKLGMQRKQHDSVIDFYQRAMEIRKELEVQLTLYNELVQYLISEEQYDRCIEILEEAIDKPELSRTREAFQFQLVSVLVQAKRTDEAFAVVEKARESDPDNLRWMYQEGFIHYNAENWEAAIKVFGPLLEKAIQQKNEGVEREVRYNLSRAMAFAGMTDEALELMSQSIAAEPDELLWQFQKGWIHYYTRNWPAAIASFEELIKTGSTGERNQRLVRQAKFSLSAAYVQNEQFDEGERVLEEIYEQNPTDASVCNDLGYLYADRNKKLEQAYEMIKIAIAAEPENKAYLDSMGWVLYRLERYEEARDYLEKAVVDSEKGDAVLWDHLGDAYHKLNQQEKAVSAWKTALEHEQNEKFPNKTLVQQIEEKLDKK